MEEAMQPEDERDDESLSDVQPVPMKEEVSTGIESIVNGLLLLGAAGVGWLVLGVLMTPTMGATRSSKLKWEQRQHEIEKAEREAHTDVDHHR
jgi:hypothetical protein